MAIILLWGGLLFSALGVAILFHEWRAIQHAVRVRGKIIGHSSGQKDAMFYYAVIEYRGFDGQTRYVQSSVGSSAPLGAIGEEMTVILDTRDANKASVQSGITFIIGGVLSAVGIGTLILFYSTFTTDWFSIAMAVLITATIARKIWQAKRKVPLTKEQWQALKQTKNPPRVFTQATKDEIRWCDPVNIAVARKRQEKSERFALPILIVLALGSFGASAYFYQNTSRFLKLALATDGRVVEMVESSSGDGSTYAPVVEFFPRHANQAIRFKHRISSSPPAYSTGQPVRVLYDPRNPLSARIDLGVWNHLPYLIPGIFGLVFALFLMRGLHLQQKRRALHRAQSPLPDSNRNSA